MYWISSAPCWSAYCLRRYSTGKQSIAGGPGFGPVPALRTIPRAARRSGRPAWRGARACSSRAGPRPISTTATTHEGHRVGRLHAEQHLRHRLRQEQRGDRADDDARRPRASWPGGPPGCTTVPSRRAERHADADLARALRHRVRQDAEDADRGEHQRDRREDRRAAACRSAAARSTSRRSDRASARSTAAGSDRPRSTSRRTASASRLGGRRRSITTLISETGHWRNGR